MTILRKKPFSIGRLAGFSAALVLLAGCAERTELDQSQLRQRADESRALSLTLGKLLKTELQAAMADGGPPAAVEVCQQRAPAIAAELSARSGWQIHRTSLKPRNRAPDAWETSVLEQFDARRRDGEAAAGIEHFEATRLAGEPVFRYMKALGTEPVCLICHGEDIDPTLAERLDALYPGDQARGFRVGDIRGAVSVVQPLYATD